jgi:nicotinamide riboside kinase
MLPLRIVIDGSHCAGKTTLLNMLAAIPELQDFAFTGEIAKRVASESGVVSREQMEELLQSHQRYDLFLRTIHEEQRKQELQQLKFVSDSSLFRNLAYAIATGRTADLFQPFDFSCHRYDLVLYCPIEFDYVGDGFRFEPLRSEVDEYLRHLLGSFNQPVVEVHGSSFQRLEQSLEAIRAARLRTPQ